MCSHVLWVSLCCLRSWSSGAWMERQVVTGELELGDGGGRQLRRGTLTLRVDWSSRSTCDVFSLSAILITVRVRRPAAGSSWGWRWLVGFVPDQSRARGRRPPLSTCPSLEQLGTSARLTNRLSQWRPPPSHDGPPSFLGHCQLLLVRGQTPRGRACAPASFLSPASGPSQLGSLRLNGPHQLNSVRSVAQFGGARLARARSR